MANFLGRFTLHQPVLPDAHPFAGHTDVLFVENEDGVDWYDLQKTLPDEGFFYIGVNADNWVMTAHDDASTLFPVDMIVYQVPGSRPDYGALLGQTFNPKTNRFTAPKPVPAGPTIEDLMARIAALEAKL